ncbi:MAG: AAA family ATPase [Candidatus Brocadiae bacterium]|nr:AAA family ATPase [Candidatus Brocadiia bacterium]
MNRIAAVVGLAGSGKSELAGMFEERGWTRIRFGDVTEQEVLARGMPLSEASERAVREEFRSEHGMAAYAVLNLPRIEAALAKGPVVCDGMYSWEEYLLLRRVFGAGFRVVGVQASPGTRYARLGARPHRPLSPQEAESRDHAEIENLHKAGPIAMADRTVINEGSRAELKREFDRLLAWLEEEPS